ncbi:MAG: glycosyltransferase family 2 protein [Lachnospiraceae bacterium]|nr:glycosyltransferase family 2 protein [Lachnospiraceae bacterium]
MSKLDFFIIRADLHAFRSDVLIFTGLFPDDNPENRHLKVYVNGKETPVELSMEQGPEIRRRYLVHKQNASQELTGFVQLPGDGVKKVQIFSCLDKEETLVYTMSGKLYRCLCHTMNGNMEQSRLEDGRIYLTGWVTGPEGLTCKVWADGKEVPAIMERKYRKDVNDLCKELDESYLAGYEISVEDTGMRRLKIELEAQGRKLIYKKSAAAARDSKNHDEDWIVKRLLHYWHVHGLKRTVRLVVRKLRGLDDAYSYGDFLKKHVLTEQELEEQRHAKFDFCPKFSIAVPLYRTKEKFLRELVTSIQKQTYGNWELCLADGSGQQENLKSLVESLAQADNRIKYTLLQENLGIAGNTNAALQMAQGDFVVLADHDDLLTEDALYQCVKALNEHPGVDVIYSDEDKVDMSGKQFFEPHFKSDYNVDLLCTMNYICHLFVFKRDLLQQVGGFESCYDGAQDHDFILRCCEVAKEIYHIPRVLYHWRCHRESTSANPESKLYAFENGCKAVEAHYKRMGIPATVEQGPFYGMYRSRYHWSETPLLSIIIPNKDHVADLKKCMDSIEERSTYRNFEFIIVENNSTEPETFAYYDSMKGRDNVTVLYYEGEFNYSRINNFGAQSAKGDYLLLLNNDTEMIEPDGLKEMLDLCMRPEVGIVGARLFFEDNTIQHAGVIIGFGGVAGHAFIGLDREANGYFSRILAVQDLSAVTAACLMVKRSVFEEVGGLEEQFRVAFNDIDFCMKVREKNYLVVYQPYATFYHYESKSRGQENSSEKVARFNQEVDLFRSRWPEILENGDPYYNPNLTLDKADFSLKE